MEKDQSHAVQSCDLQAWPTLPLEAWEETYMTVHRWTQIVGKIRLALCADVNHWWHTTLYLTPRGLTTGPMPYGERTFQMDFDFVAHQLHVTTADGLAPGIIGTTYVCHATVGHVAAPACPDPSCRSRRPPRRWFGQMPGARHPGCQQCERRHTARYILSACRDRRRGSVGQSNFEIPVVRGTHKHKRLVHQGRRRARIRSYLAHGNRPPAPRSEPGSARPDVQARDGRKTV